MDTKESAARQAAALKPKPAKKQKLPLPKFQMDPQRERDLARRDWRDRKVGVDAVIAHLYAARARMTVIIDQLQDVRRVVEECVQIPDSDCAGVPPWIKLIGCFCETVSPKSAAGRAVGDIVTRLDAVDAGLNNVKQLGLGKGQSWLTKKE